MNTMNKSAQHMRPTAQEMAAAHDWGLAASSAEAPVRPFSFLYNGRSSTDLLPSWSIDCHTEPLDAHRTARTLTCTDPETGLAVCCESIAHLDYPAIEWVVHFTNTGAVDTPIIEDVQALDWTCHRDTAGEFVLHHARGSNAAIDDFQPIDTPLPPRSTCRMHSFGVHPWGMSSVEELPFFTVDADGKGLIAAVGWSGAWAAEFECDAANGLRMRAGMDATHLWLHPGETIRTPRMLVLCWDGERMRAQNLWRRLILDHYTPRPGGQPLQVPLCGLSWGELTAIEQIDHINWWKAHELPIECFWIDAGWSGTPDDAGDCFKAAANRAPRADLYPDGLKPVSDAAHTAGMRFLLWVWPGLARVGVEIGAEHPEWVLPGGEFDGLDYGDPAVLRWLIETHCRLIDAQGLDIFRQDGHSIIPPDTDPDRTGMNQIRYTEGFYTFWDALLAHAPHLIIDNCAGGGRKIDIETMQRSVPLWRSDYQTGPNGLCDYDAIGIQCQTWGLSQWVPLSAATTVDRNDYTFRSSYSPGLAINWFAFATVRAKTIDADDYDFDLCRTWLHEYLAVRKFFTGDFYPLTPYSLDASDWMAWQFDRPDLGAGLLQAFRRPACPDESATYRLFGLDPAAMYAVTNLDAPDTIRKSGHALITEGVVVTLTACPGAAVIVYRQVAP